MAKHPKLPPKLPISKKKPTASKSTINSQTYALIFQQLLLLHQFMKAKTVQTLTIDLQFYKINQKEVPSITGDVIPEYVSSFNQYKQDVIERYSKDLAKAGAGKTLLNREWVNSRGVIFRFDRCALEVRVMDEQECIKSDVALSCFVRATLRGLIALKAELLPHDLLVKDFNAIVKDGLNAQVSNPHGKTARQVCQHYLNLAFEYADEDEKKYLVDYQETTGKRQSL